MVSKPIASIIAVFFALIASGPIAAEPATPADQKVISACIAKAKSQPERCIGAIYNPCTKTSTGGSTMGMGQCAGREIAVWDAMLNSSYQTLLSSSLGDTDAMPENRPAENR